LKWRLFRCAKYFLFWHWAQFGPKSAIEASDFCAFDPLLFCHITGLL
jgi:hypothetical protein